MTKTSKKNRPGVEAKKFSLGRCKSENSAWRRGWRKAWPAAVLNGAWPLGCIFHHEMWPARLVRSFCMLQVRGSVGLVRMASGGTDRALNRLAQEKSPYLLQHASNPVDWYEQHTSSYYHTVFLFDRGSIIFISTCNRLSLLLPHWLPTL